METIQLCPECGAAWQDGKTCQDDFYQMLAWETEDPARWAEAHHLMVLCYHLQHPHLYSPEGLEYAMQLLVQFMEQGIPPNEVLRRSRDAVDSSKRTWKIKGTPDSYGSYKPQIQWVKAAGDVVAGGANNYADNVKAWAQSVYDTLKASGTLPAK